MVSVIGSPISPYVKKVLTLLNLKGVAFEIDPITPFFGDDRFTELSPLRRIPVLIHGDIVLKDSSVIAQYIEETWPSPAALPANAADRAQARWLEEYASSRMGDVFIWKGFAAMIVAPYVFKTEPDTAAFEKNIVTDVADVMDYLESQAPDDGFFVGEFSLADIAIAAMFRNMKYVKWTPDPDRWPKTCAWLVRAEAQPCLSLANEWSDLLITVPPPEWRKLAAEAGLKLTADSYAVETPRRGPMSKIG